MKRELIDKYVDQGFKIFPCNANKTPANSKGFLEAHDDKELLYKQFFRDTFLIGLPCGDVNGIVIIDIDIKDGRSVDDLKEELKTYGEFPPTFEVETMSGGRHLYYKVNSTRLRSAVRFFDKTLPVDIRANGGYCVTFDYRQYFPLDCEDDSDVKSLMAELPEWVENYKKPSEYSDTKPVEKQLQLLPASEVREIRSALCFLDADDRDLWVRIGHACKSTETEQAKGLWLEWSMKSEKFDPVDSEQKWKSFEPHDITIASVFGYAKQKGWVTTYTSTDNNAFETLTPEQIEARINLPKSYEKKKFPTELLKPPGYVGEVMEYMNSQAIQDQPILHLAAALTFTGAVLGRKVRTEKNARTNIYCVGLGESGCGKDNARQCIKEIVYCCNDPMMAGLATVETLASDAAVYNALYAFPSPIFLLDEIGRFLQTTNSAQNSHLHGVVDVFLKAYSSARTSMPGKNYADTKRNISINNPNLCIYGTATPDQFYESLTKKSIEEGLVARMLIFESENPFPDTNDDIEIMKPSGTLIENTRALFHRPTNCDPKGNLSGTEVVNPLIIPYTKEAKAMVKDFNKEIQMLRQKLESENKIHSIYNRCGLICEQIALILACGCAIGEERPIIKPEHVDYGRNLTRHIFDNLHYDAENRISSSSQEKNVKDVLREIRKHGKILNKDLVKKFHHLKSNERKDVMETLLNSELVEEHIEITADNKRKKVFIAV